MAQMREMRDKFLSEEDLDLRNLTTEELHAYWDHWLLQAQATNDRDRYTYSHGVFVNMEEPHDEDDEDDEEDDGEEDGGRGAAGSGARGDDGPGEEQLR